MIHTEMSLQPMVVFQCMCDASHEKVRTASLLQAQYDSTTRGMHVHPTSKHFTWLADCFLSQWPLPLLLTPTSEEREGLSGDVTVRSKVAGLPESQLQARMSAGGVC